MADRPGRARSHVSGLPRPLPECIRCGAPMPRRVWVLRRACAGCATAVERMAGAMTAHELERARAATSARVDARIEALAARRAARSTEAQT